MNTPPDEPLTTFFRHHQWANLRLLEACASLTPAQLDASAQGLYGSIQETLRHMITSEQSYFSRISTGQPYRRPEDAQPLTLDEMIESARTTGAGLIEWAAKVQPNETVRVVWKDGVPRDVPKAIILVQVINHAMEHRTQITAILTQLGIEPPDLQSWAYFEELTSS